MTHHALAWLHNNAPEVGGWILFIDMILGAALLAVWDKAGKFGSSAHNRKL